MKIIKVKQNSQEVDRICARGVAPTEEIHQKVKKILEDVRTGGMAKAVEYAQKFDGLQGKKLSVSESQIAKLADKVSPTLAKALRQAIKNPVAFH